MEEQTYEILISLDYEGFDDWKTREVFNLTHDQMLQFWREFRRWILIHVGGFLLNKRHIVTIKFLDLKESEIDSYMRDVMSLEEWPILSPDED